MQDTKHYQAYLQVCGVNIYASVYDTSQLSIVRGSSLLLKWAVELLDGAHIEKTQDEPPLYSIIQVYKQTIRNKYESDHIPELNRLAEFVLPLPELIKPLTAITTGASSGIYEVNFDKLPNINGKLDEKLAKYVQEIAHFLSNHDYFRYFTFTVVGLIDESNDFTLVKECLLGKSRRQQIHQISLAPQPILEALDKPAQPCTLQGILPAVCAMKDHPKDYKGKLLAPACQYRFLLGRYLRHGLYASEIQALLDVQKNSKDSAGNSTSFAQSDWTDCGNRIEELKENNGYEAWLNSLLGQLKLYDAAESFNEIRDREDYPNLENKIAVFYADGNGFGKIQAKWVKTVEHQIHFDDTLKTYRREFLACLLQQWMPKDGKGILPLETLLWGGDEMMFVVPSSKGFALAQMFYQQSRNWWIELDGTKHKLTHAGGLVFCHYKTPIGRVKKLAEDLADEIKEREYGREGNYFDYAVLESIDYPAEETLDEFFFKRYGALAKHRFPLQPLAAVPDIEIPQAEGKPPKYPQHNAPAFNWVEQVKHIAEFLVAMPKSQAYQIAQATQTDTFEKKLKRFNSLQKDNPVLLKQLEELIQNGVLRLPPKSTAQSNKPTDANQNLPTAELGEESARHENADQTYIPAVINDPWQWLHLVELWDYLVPRKKAQVKGGTPS